MKHIVILLHLFLFLIAGAAGLSMGRNAFQHEKPVRLVAAACAIVHKGKTAAQAMKILKGKA